MCAPPRVESFGTPRELDRWPEEAVTALKAQKILRKAGPARGTVCPGCERQCPMPLHGPAGPSGRPESGRNSSSLFIVCDKREDTHRVPVPADSLARWEMSADMVGRFVADRLSRRWKGRKPEGKDVLEIGIAGKGKQRRMLSQRLKRELRLAAGSSELNFSGILRFRDGSYRLEESVVHRWLDGATEESPITATQVRYESRKLDTRKKNFLLQKACRGAETGAARHVRRLVRASDRQERPRRRTQPGYHPQADEKVENQPKKVGQVQIVPITQP